MNPVVKRPWHLWVVGILSLIWNAGGAFDYLMTQTRNESYMSKFTPEQLDYFYGFPSWVVAAWATAVWFGVAGSLLLILRRKLAIPVFVISFAAMVLTTIHNYLLTDGAEIMGGAGTLVFSAMIFVAAALLPIYARRQAQLGRLV